MVHGSNLSNGTNMLEWVEINTVMLFVEEYQQLRPVDPNLMQSKWQTLNTEPISLQPELAVWLWGDGAQERSVAYWRERNAPPFVRRLRLALARRGLLSSVEWDVHHKPKDSQ